MYLEIENFLSAEECRALIAISETGDFKDGLATAKGMSHKVKRNEQLAQSEEQRKEVRNILVSACNRSERLMAFAQPAHVDVPLLSRYREGMKYGRHLDTPFSSGPRTIRRDLSMTVFLRDPESYDGGALVLDTDFGKTECKMPAGGAVCYSTMVFHEVAPVTRGERLALVTWFQSRIRSIEHRALLCDLALALSEVMARDPASAAAERLQRSVLNMQRLWGEP